MAILYVGIDLAKSVFAVHGVNEAGKAGELVRPKRGACQAARTGRGAAAVHGGHGSVHGRAPLGAVVHGCKATWCG
jgi:hypothetical protein